MFHLYLNDESSSQTGTVSVFESLPDKIKANIFRHLRYQDIFRCHLLCRSIRQYLLDNITEFDRPDLTELRLEVISCGPISKQLRLSFRCFSFIDSHACLKHREFILGREFARTPLEIPSNLLSLIEEKCKYIIAHGLIIFDSILFNESLCSCVLKWSSQSSAFCFTNCRVDLPPENFSVLLSNSKCRKLDMDSCCFDQPVISDQVLRSMNECERLHISNCQPSSFDGITSDILNKWETQRRLPKEIYLEGNATQITAHGIIHLVQEFINRYGQWLNRSGDFADIPQIEWSFGQVKDSSNFREELSNLAGILWEVDEKDGHVRVSFESLHQVIGESVPAVQFSFFHV
ncbi:hypothetical protein AB6A40_000916 [Gnathostoma spinigerum]|uniref:F-box domain-containing protein n=1 Tax=Gnathostoma spinigerum TaxID=75299 RepID=A0ABD6EBZ0_9BILA